MLSLLFSITGAGGARKGLGDYRKNEEQSIVTSDFILLLDRSCIINISSAMDLGTSQMPQTIYRCKRCQRIVASQENVVQHNPGEGEQCFKWKKRDNHMEDDRKPECSSIFVEPMKWMQVVQEGVVEEKLWCLGCKARLGSFNWAGMQCSCGAWVNPAFQLHKSRIDESSV